MPWVRTVSLVVALLGFLLLPAAASAQSSIAGVVKDSSGAVLPGVQVDASSPVLIEQTRTVVTDSQGVFRIIDLRPGTYKVTFTLQGFSTFERDGVVLPAGFTATVNADMKLGQLAETITVSGEAPVVDVHTASQSQQVITSEVRNAIPLSSNAAAFAALIPAATQAAADRDVGGIRGENSQAFSIHGSHTADMIMLRDGLDYDQFFSGGNKESGGGRGDDRADRELRVRGNRRRTDQRHPARRGQHDSRHRHVELRQRGAAGRQPRFRAARTRRDSGLRHQDAL